MSVELYGIGNALVDQEYAIQDDFLTKIGLTKGTMQLAEQDAQLKLTAALNAHTSSAGQVSGGSGANSVYAFSALGGQAFYACRVGHDDLVVTGAHILLLSDAARSVLHEVGRS